MAGAGKVLVRAAVFTLAALPCSVVAAQAPCPSQGVSPKALAIFEVRQKACQQAQAQGQGEWNYSTQKCDSGEAPCPSIMMQL